MKPFLKELFEYNNHYNQKLAEAFDANPERASEKAVSLYSHILNAHQIWINRIEPRQAPFGVWEIHSVEVFKRLDTANYEQTIILIDKVDLNHLVNYTNSKGHTFHNSIRDVLFHVVNHSTYHRAQIATEFKQNGIAPLVTDFIAYKR